MKLSVPFIPDPAYADFLAGHGADLASVYFPLPTRIPLDARVRVLGNQPGENSLPDLIETLGPIRRVNKYILANTRFTAPDFYMDASGLRSFLDDVEILDQSVGIQGIVVSDLYLLKALDRTGHGIVPRLQAIPGINTMIDNSDRFTACMDVLESTRFAPPGRLILDRSLNRSPRRLKRVYDSIKTALPEVQIELLANEGCIFNCPFKPAHDAHIALSNTGLVREATWRTNQTLGCHAYFTDHPHQFLKSPFIRPEDADRYRGMADALKICGRTLGTGFLRQCITAYARGSFQGNLLDIMDAARFLAQRFHISNPDLDPDFFSQVTACTKDCKRCRICETLFQRTAIRNPVELTSYEDIS